ncbi:MAG TPA: zf-HC2 domain-containing protein [Candidatus Limnocylindrales bacterium]|nr:zf-HC2 domain-containing protein [Candidatus Limnocylindrales bacterium]
MTVIGGRGGRNDDWSSDHARARARAAERLDGPLDLGESAWLDEHLASCEACSAVAADYAGQRLELRALRDREPVPPRDLWARTSAALERESRHRPPRRRNRASTLRPYALLAGALVVAIAVGTLSSSQFPFGGATATPGATTEVAVASETAPPIVAPTPLAVDPQDVAYLTVEEDGTYSITQGRIDEVCPASATDCTPDKLVERKKHIGPLASPETVFGSDGQPFVVLGDGENGQQLFAVVVPPEEPGPTETPPASTEPPPSDEPTGTAVPASDEPTGTASPPSTESPAAPSDEPTPTPSQATETVAIATDLEIIGTTAAYAPDGSAFAFTAQPTDGLSGPDIYVWTVGDDEARAVTTDHQSVFGSWAGDDIIGSSIDVSEDGTSALPRAILVSGDDAPAALPGAGLAWRPAVDPSGETAVYWAGTLAPTDDPSTWDTQDGRLVIGRWGELEAPDPSASAAPPDASDQAEERRETTIVEGPLTDWDVRWDETGRRLAVWLADSDDPSVGRLSLYDVDPFDGSIDLENPPLEDEPALAGFSIDDGRLAWAAPPEGTDDESRVLILAWTDEGFGQVESAPGDFLLVR